MRRNKLLKSLFVLGTPVALMLASVSCSNSTTSTPAPKPPADKKPGQEQPKEPIKTTTDPKPSTPEKEKPITPPSTNPTKEKPTTPSASKDSEKKPEKPTSEPSKPADSKKDDTTTNPAPIDPTPTPVTPPANTPSTGKDETQAKSTVHPLSEKFEKELSEVTLYKKVSTDEDFNRYFTNIKKPIENSHFTSNYTESDFLADVWILQNAFSQVRDLVKVLKENNDANLEKYINREKTRFNTIFKEVDRAGKKVVRLDVSWLNSIAKTVTDKLTNSIPGFIHAIGIGFIPSDLNKKQNATNSPKSSTSSGENAVRQWLSKLDQKSKASRPETLLDTISKEIPNLSLYDKMKDTESFKKYFENLKKPLPNKNLNNSYTREELNADIYILEDAYSQVKELINVVQEDDDKKLLEFINKNLATQNSIFIKENNDVKLNVKRLNDLYKTITSKLNNSLSIIHFPGFGFYEEDKNSQSNNIDESKYKQKLQEKLQKIADEAKKTTKK
ncbi:MULTISPECIES: hypothetical protein [unclassified Mycoplasma]|uniref:hypothetical protein n=1 Tax=unclassified Mycoplasma TaxID=2683645 RepID=UPI00211C218E|nr:MULTISPECIES: hypothetical protein [unclassified Mycoplasma]UUM19930.1 hypothetical protein NPA11_00620 [Mycoplasma sp. 1578d]UUM24911.1 hypothetical protein NPA12_00605 [Mycoplasma sp. 3686d]